MSGRGRTRGYLGMSLDGRIAGPEDDLGWLHEVRGRVVDSPVPATGGTWLGYDDFIAGIGVLLMGRRTFDVVHAFDAWPYGDLAVVVATHRSLPDDVPGTVTAIEGPISDVVAAATRRAGGRDVYVDGGRLVCDLLDAGLLDELTTTVLPTVRGPGVGLFDALRGPHALDVVRVVTNDGGAVQLTWVPQPAP